MIKEFVEIKKKKQTYQEICPKGKLLEFLQMQYGLQNR